MSIRSFCLTALALFCIAAPALAQGNSESGPAIIAIFPFKNLTGHVQYDDLSWDYVDSLISYLNTKEGAGTTYELVPAIDIRDQMLALNVDVKSPSYETDVWTIAKALEADKIVWGTYLVKYEKANIEAKIFDVQTIMPDQENQVKKFRPKYEDALSTVVEAGEKLYPGLQ